jgi:predicted RNase H-like HicB family nuclease
MSKKSKESVAKNRAALPLDRPFDKTVWSRAQRVAAGYGFLIQPHPEVGYFARGFEMPNVFADGSTPQACVAAIREALEVATATMLEMGETPPPPANDAVRQEQINIRVSAEEKLLMEEAARRKGFRGVSDFVRTTTLSSLR